MAETPIEWTRNPDGSAGKTWNPTTGCDRVSPGCGLNGPGDCYAAQMAKRLKAMGQPKYQNDGDPRTSGPGFALTTHPDTLEIPLRWKKPTRVFVNSMSDLFHKDVPEAFIADVWTTMRACPQHTFQILTKRPQRMREVVARIAWRTAVAGERSGYHAYLCDTTAEAHGSRLLPGVWLGTSIESDRYTFRADHLRATPAAVRFLSLEPLLGPLPSLDLTGIDWVIVGGQSGRGAVPMHRSWARDIRDRCIKAGIPFHYKQHGAWVSYTDGELHADLLTDGHRQCVMDRDGVMLGEDEPCDIEREPTLFLNLGKKAAGRKLDGREWNEFPESVPC